MMILDTHTLLWFLSDDEQLPRSLKQHIEDADAVFVSIVSLWEIAIKLNVGKLSLPTPFDSLETDVEASGIEILSISFADLQQYRSLPLHHRDPFDRLLVAQALERGFELLSRDLMLDAYGVRRSWG